MTVRPLGAVALCFALASIPTLPAGAAPTVTPAAAPAPPSPVCPTTAPANANQVAGYTLATFASGAEADLSSPGTLPLGDPIVGQILGLDVPLARLNVSAGPVIDALASPSYPGDAAGHVGTALSTFGLPPVVPNYPIIAEANFPSTPAHGATSTFSTGGSPLEVAAGKAVASDTAATSHATVAAVNLASSLNAGTSTADSAADLTASCVDASANAVSAGINIAGIVNIAGVTGYAAARSDGQTGVPQAQLQVGKVTVAGLDAYIDRDGIHLAGQQAGSGIVASVESLLQSTLSAAGITVKLLEPTTAVHGGQVSANSGAIVVTAAEVIPGFGGIQGLPLPVNTQIAFGLAEANVDASSVPSTSPPPPATTGTQTSTPTGGTGGGIVTTPTGEQTIAPSTSVAIPAPVPGGAGSTVFAANAAAAPAPGSPVPIGWLIVGFAAAIVAIGPLLGYARWQLLEGRI